jgi:hypothetical protein
MKRYFASLAIFAIFMALGCVATVVAYAAVLLVLWFILSQFGVSDLYWWTPLAGTGLVFFVALLTALRDRLPDITQLTWDSGTTEDAPSQFDYPGPLGRFWNVNPLGTQSVASIGAVGAVLLGMGPSLFITAFVCAIEEWTAHGEHDSGGNGGQRH